MLLLYNVGVFVPGSNTFYCLVMENLRSRRGKSNKEMMFLQLKSKTFIFMDWVANWWSRYGFSSASTKGLHGLVNFSKSECLSRPLFHNLFFLNRQFLPCFLGIRRSSSNLIYIIFYVTAYADQCDQIGRFRPIWSHCLEPSIR